MTDSEDYSTADEGEEKKDDFLDAEWDDWDDDLSGDEEPVDQNRRGVRDQNGGGAGQPSMAVVPGIQPGDVPAQGQGGQPAAAGGPAAAGPAAPGPAAAGPAAAAPAEPAAGGGGPPAPGPGAGPAPGPAGGGGGGGGDVPAENPEPARPEPDNQALPAVHNVQDQVNARQQYSTGHQADHTEVDDANKHHQKSRQEGEDRGGGHSAHRPAIHCHRDLCNWETVFSREDVVYVKSLIDWPFYSAHTGGHWSAAIAMTDKGLDEMQEQGLTSVAAALQSIMGSMTTLGHMSKTGSVEPAVTLDSLKKNKGTLDALYYYALWLTKAIAAFGPYQIKANVEETASEQFAKRMLESQDSHSTVRHGQREASAAAAPIQRGGLTSLKHKHRNRPSFSNTKCFFR
jgi:hypothetical protein